ncbi:Na+/H+ antiporter NhaA, partial [Vibrio parahaemolyticus]|nr:Na+/H+ antiporter NhaA [Vibrio parahaemolyticus]EIU7735397.1 Na+/H+ antiporter NhaA [Vibrio parahaemolyticus]
ELVLGELRNPKLAVLSIAAALGGMLLPPLFYLFIQFGEPGHHGWGTVMATDTAFVIGCLALLGRSIPSSLRIFMLSMAVVDDIGAIFVVAIGYGNDIEWRPVVYALIGFIIVRGMSFLGVRSIVLFSLVGGMIWLSVDMSGIHPTITGVILGLLTPTNKWVSKQHLSTIVDSIVASSPMKQWSGDKIEGETLRTAAAAARETLSPVERLEMLLHPWVGFIILPLFAFSNAGISLTSTNATSPITFSVFLGFVFGKPIGIVLFSWISVRLRLAMLPENMNWGMIFGGGMLAGIGFTMALFISELAYSPDQINAAKLGIFSASICSALLGLTFLRYFSVREKQNNI